MCFCVVVFIFVWNLLIIVQNGVSGDYLGSILFVYVVVVKGGFDYIECLVQIIKDGVFICWDGVNLVNIINVVFNLDLFEIKFIIYQEMGLGVFFFDFILEEIRILRGILFLCQFCVIFMIFKLFFGLRI